MSKSESFKIYEREKDGKDVNIELIARFTNINQEMPIRSHFVNYFKNQFEKDYQFYCAKIRPEDYFDTRKIGTFTEIMITYSKKLFVRIFIKTNDAESRGFAKKIKKLFNRIDEHPLESFREDEKDIEQKIDGRTCSTFDGKRLCELDFNNAVVITEPITIYRITSKNIYANYKNKYFICKENMNETRILIDSAIIETNFFRDIITKTEDIQFKYYLGIN